ncbi:MAG: PqqD family protein [Armatimonadota bacterium]
MSLLSGASSLLQRFGLKRGQPPLSREQAFEARPVRNPRLAWRVNDEECVEVIVPRRKDLLGRVMGFLFMVPESRPVILDEVGTRVWHLCDGEHTVAEMARILADEYKLARREIETTLPEYLRTLGKKGMIGLLVPKQFLANDQGELMGLAEVGTTREELEAARREADRDTEDALRPGEASADDGPAEERGDPPPAQ